MPVTLADQLRHRLDLARVRGRDPVRWRVSPAKVDALKSATADLWEGPRRLLGLPVVVGAMQRDWGIELICDPPARGSLGISRDVPTR